MKLEDLMTYSDFDVYGLHWERESFSKFAEPDVDAQLTLFGEHGVIFTELFPVFALAAEFKRWSSLPEIGRAPLLFDENGCLTSCECGDQ